MSGAKIYQFCSDLLTMIIDFSTSTIQIFGSKLSVLSSAYIPWDWLKSLIISITDSIGDPTLLELTIGSIGLMVAISLVKWLVGIIT